MKILRQFLSLGVGLLATLAVDAATHAYSWELPAAAGDYAGEQIDPDGSKHPLFAQVIADEGGAFRVRFSPNLSVRDEPFIVLNGEARYGSIILKPKLQIDSLDPIQVTTHGVLLKASQWSGGIRAGLLSGFTAGATPSRFTLQALGHQRYAAATLGATPPPGAKILFDGRSLAEFTGPKEAPAGWVIVDGGAMQVRDKGGLISRTAFGDHQIHLEFRSSWMPTARGQQRANSGVYVQGRYEIQVLDSYGLEGEWNECGGIYQIAQPLVNMCAPPTVWQSYDIDFTAPRFDASGKKTANARVTVRHNGVIIHDHLELPEQTDGGLAHDEIARGPLYLQNHAGDAVQFRNIWVLEKP